MNLSSSKALTIALTLVSAVWLALVCILAVRFNVPSSDGILYSLPFATAKHPFDFGIPLLNDFEGYGSTWGHHWPGAMWLKGLVFYLIPYSRVADVAVLSLFQLLAATVAARLVWKTTGKLWPAAATWTLILSDRLLLLTCAGNRFEPVAVAVVLLWFAHSVTGLGRRDSRWRWGIRGVAFLCPTLHPYSFIMGGIILGHDFLATRSSPGNPRKEWFKLLGAFLCGCFAVAVWFLSQPEALRQFTANLALQKSFYQSWNTVAGGLANYRLGGGLALWAAGLVSAALLAAGWPGSKSGRHFPVSPAWRFLAPALLVSVILIHTGTRCENFSYLAFGSPFAVMLLNVTAGCASSRGAQALSVAVVASITAMHAILIPYRTLQFKQAGTPNLHAELSMILADIPANRKIFIPHPFWAAAIHDLTHTIRFFTLPIASPRSVRESYERKAYADAKRGDILIIDNAGAGQPDRFGLYPTFPIHPPTPANWTLIEEHEVVFPGAIPWGLDLSIYEYQ